VDSSAKSPYFKVYPSDNSEEDLLVTHTISSQNYKLHFKLQLQHIQEETSFSHLQYFITGMHRRVRYHSVSEWSSLLRHTTIHLWYL